MTRVVLLAAVACLVGPRPLVAQARDSIKAPTGAFIGRIISSIDSAPAQSVEVRLLFVDSSRTVTSGSGDLDVFLDSTRTRIGVSDSTGVFAIRMLAAGHYLFRLRRIGYQPMDGVLSVGDDTVRAKIVMEVASVMLAKVQISESSVDRVKQQLDRRGFTSRSHLGISATFLNRKEILRRNRNYLGDILSAYGVHNGDVVIDRMPLTFDDVRDFPAELVIGIEIYRHNRPAEFGGTMAAGSVMRTGGLRPPLVVVWTFPTGH